MQRVTVSLDDSLAEAFDALARARGYQSRSEAVRDLMREAVTARRLEQDDGWCVANLSYVYNHHERSLASRLAAVGHAHHDRVMATAHVHLDHDHCLETMMLKGPVSEVRALAQEIQAERGVRHGMLNIIDVTPGDAHAHPHTHHHHGAEHLSPHPG